MTYLLTNVAKTQDVRLNGTIFFGNTGQKDRATFMNKNIPIEYPKLVETYRIRISSSTTPFNNKKPRYDIPPYKCCYNLGCPVGRYYFLR